MTDFQFINGDGTINETLRTDFVGSNYQGGGNLTICQKISEQTATEIALFAFFKRTKYTIQDFKNFAVTNNLTLLAYPVGKPGSPVAIALGAASPGSFAGAVISATQINLTWAAVANASAYIVDRATNAGFTTGVALAIFNGTALLFNNTGLVTATTYFYRITAVVNGVNSPYSTISRTTS